MTPHPSHIEVKKISPDDHCCDIGLSQASGESSRADDVEPT